MNTKKKKIFSEEIIRVCNRLDQICWDMSNSNFETFKQLLLEKIASLYELTNQNKQYNVLELVKK